MTLSSIALQNSQTRTHGGGYIPHKDLNSLQEALLPYVQEINSFWILAFAGVTFFLLYYMMRYGGFVRQPVSADPNAVSHDFTESENPIIRAYQKLFHIRDIASDIRIPLFGGTILLSYILTFARYLYSADTSLSGLENGRVLCWPFFKSCSDFIFMEVLPHGYSQSAIFMVMLGVICLAAYALLARRYTLSHLCILVLFSFQAYLMLINYSFKGNYYYYNLAFSFVFLFARHRVFFGCLTVAMFYFLSTATKIHEGWTLGTYFTWLDKGLPLFPDSLAAIFSNGLIFMEMIAVWFLFSKYKLLQRLITGFFIFFHLYSGILVGYLFPAMSMPALIVLFGPLYRSKPAIPSLFRDFAGWSLVVTLFCLQMISHTIPGDEKITMEGNFYGLYMFEANHQCEIRMIDANDNGLVSYNNFNSHNRCDTYEFMARGQARFCRPEALVSNVTFPIRFTVTHSINGGPFYRIVDEKDLCALTYKPFQKNDWIKDQETAPILGFPSHKSYYR